MEKTSRKKLFPVLAAAGVLISAVVVAVAGCAIDPFAEDLAAYAPAGTNGICRINGKKISQNKVVKAWQKTLAYEKMANDAKKEGIDLTALLQGEGYVFAGKVDTEISDKVSGVYRDRNGQAKKIQEIVAKDGKNDFKDVAAAMLNENTVAFTRKGAAPLVKGKVPALAAALDRNALISSVSKIELTDEQKKLFESEQAQMFKDIVIGLDKLNISLCEIGDDLELKLEGEYKNAEEAKKANESLIALRKLGETFTQGEETKDIADVLKKIEISARDKKITIALKYPMDKIIALIEEQDKKYRAEAKAK